MKILYFDVQKNAPLVSRLQSEGIEVIQHSLESPIDPSHLTGDIALFGVCAGGTVADQLHDLGIPTVGSSRTTELIPAAPLQAVLKAFDFPSRKINGISCVLCSWWDGKKLTMNSLNVPDVENIKGGFREVGVVSFPVRKESRLMSLLNDPLRDFLNRGYYLGPVQVYIQANSKDITVGGLRFGLDTLITYTTLELWGYSVRSFLNDITNGTLGGSKRGEAACGVEVWSDEPLTSTFKQVWPFDGGAHVVARGRGPGESLRRAYRTITNLAPEDTLVYSRSVGVSAKGIKHRVEHQL